MIFIRNEDNLVKEKIHFFNNNLDFINHHMPDTIRNYVSAFINNEIVIPFDIQNMKITGPDQTVPDHRLFYCILYVCSREKNIYWEDFFYYMRPLYTSLENKFSVDFLYDNTTSPQSDLYVIRQCRPDKPEYTQSANVNVGLCNKNENFTYKCYDNEAAITYLTNYCSAQALQAYNNIQFPQAKSDFFLMASLYTDGGVLADVCSVGQSNLEVLIKDTELLLIYDAQGIHKKFAFSQSRNLFILYHLNYMIGKMADFGADEDYEQFSSRSSFHHNFMDFYAFYYHDIKNIKLTFLHNDVYKAFVSEGVLEENLSLPSDFPYLVAKGLFQKEKVTTSNQSRPLVGDMTKNFYMPPTKNLFVVGQNNNPHFLQRVNNPYSLSSLNVWRVEDVDLSGLGWVWKDGQYISFESHLSDLAYDPTYQQNWAKPTKDNITNVIEDECIVAFSAGSPCYGHYLVDDLPRIGLIKDYLGDEFYNKKFIVSHETPEWGKELYKFFFGLEDHHFITFDFSQERWKLKKVILSSFVSKDNYNFHNYIHDFYKSYHKTEVKPHRKVCLSRALCNPNTRHQRIFKSREFFEHLALSHGFEVVCPEVLPIQEQIQLMSETVCQIGEHGSAQHSSVFNPNGMVVGTINPIGDIQVALGRIFKDKNVICYSDSFEWGGPNNEVLYYDIDHQKIIRFFDKVLEELGNS